MGAHENASVSDRRLYERVRWHHRSGRSSIWLPRFSVTCDCERRLASRSVEHACRPLCRESDGTCMGQTRHTAPALGSEPGSERGQTWCVSDLAVLAISDTHRSERCVHSVDLVATTGSQTQVREILGNQILDPLRTRQTLPVRAPSSTGNENLASHEMAVDPKRPFRDLSRLYDDYSSSGGRCLVAHTAAWVRSETLIRWKRRPQCDFTVFSLIPSSRPICLLL